MEHIEDGIEPTRIEGSCDLKLDDLKCGICEKIVWNVVTCENCGALFCSACVANASDRSSNECVNGCRSFVETKVHRFIIEQLARLKIVCSNQPLGCIAIVHYDDLEKHEKECGYQQEECSGCHRLQLIKDYTNHLETCLMIAVECLKCHLAIPRGDILLHTECRCLIEQLRNNLNEHKLHTAEQFKQIEEGLKRNDELQQLRNEFEEFRRQTGDQIKQIVELNYRLQERFETNKQQTNEQIHRVEQNLQQQQQPNTNIQKALKTLDLYEKADIRCSCGGRFCQRCGGCRDWKRNGKGWKRISNGCRFHPNTDAGDVCQCV
ncbi:unnamed protein product [Adineta ricciae]|uniref:Uncharacterized protein n=1 Tax=Adineta ricciae TaxID=249248 RepID=A0A815JXF8_ADIRI|nr:unnamed protein product [Adineta ricciae]